MNGKEINLKYFCNFLILNSLISENIPVFDQ